MPKISVTGPRFFSAEDESYFFAWLQGVKGVSRVRGEGSQLHFTVSARISEAALRELLAVHQRYRLPMRHLAQLATAQNSAWFMA